MASTEPARVSNSLTSYKRGCLWYGLVASAIIAVLFVLGLFLALESPNTSVPAHSILVSAQERTYLEVVDEQVPEGFPDYHYEMRIYYTRLGGWFEPTVNKKARYLAGFFISIAITSKQYLRHFRF
jgi:hypothetical protein